MVKHRTSYSRSRSRPAASWRRRSPLRRVHSARSEAGDRDAAVTGSRAQGDALEIAEELIERAIGHAELELQGHLWRASDLLALAAIDELDAEIAQHAYRVVESHAPGLIWGEQVFRTMFEPGRLFLVGDPKQSIYRSRRADVAIYARTREMVEGDGTEFSTLALNRRSRRAIIDWVNRVFGAIIGDGGRAHVQPAYARIHAERAGDLRGPGVAVIGGAVDDSARAVRQHEAGVVAAQCRIAIQDGWEVQEREGVIGGALSTDATPSQRPRACRRLRLHVLLLLAPLRAINMTNGNDHRSS